MLAHKSKHFKTVLQTMILFKYQAQAYEKQLGQAIKLMHTDELYQNIIHSKFETVLIKQILVFLLDKFHNPQFDKSRIGGASHYFKANFISNRKQIIEHYYTQMALSEYFHLTHNEDSHKKYVNSYNFCELDEQLKFAILKALVKNVSSNLRVKGSKTKEKDEEEGSKQENQSKVTKIEELLILGEDNKYVYYYAPFLPEYVITYYLGQWGVLDKFAVIEKMRKLLSEPMSTNNLFLCQSLDAISSKYMKVGQKKPPSIRFLSVQQNYKEISVQRMRNAKKELLLLNERYCRYLKNFDNQCWGYLSHREKYINQLEKAKSFDDLIEAHKFMYKCSSSKIYKCLCDSEVDVPQNKQSEFYQAKTRYNCNIHTISIPFRIDQIIKSQSFSQILIQGQDVDFYAYFEFNVLVMKQAMNSLEKKQKKYMVKSKEKLVKQAKRNQENSVSLLEKKNQSKQGMSLRPKKKERNKRFGVTMIDSDESQSDSMEFKSTSTGIDMRKYEYKTRSCAQK